MAAIIFQGKSTKLTKLKSDFIFCSCKSVWSSGLTKLTKLGNSMPPRSLRFGLTKLTKLTKLSLARLVSLVTRAPL
jgi:hypothetical protein